MATGELKRFPGIEARGLDGRRYRIPGDFEDRPTIVVLAFHRSQQRNVDGWMPSLLTIEQRFPGVRVYEVPTISRSWSPFRWMIDGGMTRGIPDPAARARTLTAYTEVDRVVEALGIGGTDEIAVAVVGEKGRVLRQVRGDFDEAKLADLVAALPG